MALTKLGYVSKLQAPNKMEGLACTVVAANCHGGKGHGQFQNLISRAVAELYFIVRIFAPICFHSLFVFIKHVKQNCAIWFWEIFEAS